MTSLSLTVPLYFFAIAFVLAYLEVQIEGPNGWAKSLPTWQARSPLWDWLLGARPMTGYHLALNSFLILFMHLPQVLFGFSLVREAETMTYFFLLSVIWDYLWFVINPHYGLKRHREGEVWWFRHWWLGFPRDYFVGIGMAMLCASIPWLIGREELSAALARVLIPFMIMSAASSLVTLVWQLPKLRVAEPKVNTKVLVSQKVEASNSSTPPE